jgi:formylglycine-generating enzyme required for sulfatase activity
VASYVGPPVSPPASGTDDAAQRTATIDKLAAERAEADRLAAQRVAAQRAAQISQLLDIARANDSPEKGKDALQPLNQVLTLDPQNAEALRLKDKISAYYAPTLTNSLKMLLVRIEPGEFMMGSASTETGHAIDETQHRVKITRAYMLGAYPVTQSQWSALMAVNPSKFKGDDLPVESVSWDDAVQFCEKLSTKEQKHYRLPTEAQWEYACRAGTTTPFYSGPTISGDLANYDAKTAYGNGVKGTSRMKTTPVGTFKPNAWGLFDMCGNVNEWCSDWYSPYPAGDAVDPTGPETPSAPTSWRVLRGGSWGSTPTQCRSGARYKSAPDNHFDFYGFRVALDP